ncbi:MAG: hypothetical protein V5A28_03780 [Haloarculaceae archaeon]
MDETTSQPEAEGPSDEPGESADIRTLAFRMREIQRLLAVRVEQENRRLAAEGLEPVTESRILDVDEE